MTLAAARFSPSAIAAFADARPEVGADDIARELAAGANETELRALAETCISLTLDRVRREQAREIEWQAYLAAGPQREAARRQEEDVRRMEDVEVADRRHQALFSDPLSNPGDRYQRRAFRTWAGERFNEWYQRGHTAAAAQGDGVLELFEGDWHPDGPAAYERERRRERVRALIETEAEYVRIETTRELLSTMFALGDGTRITWGAATVAQHRQRIEMLTVNAAGIIEAATRHHAAIRMIEGGDASCLNELAVSRRAAA